MQTEYEKQAQDFLDKTGATLEIVFSHHGKHFANDTETRDIYICTLKRGRRSYRFDFGNSIANSGFYYTKGRQKVNLDRSLLYKSNQALISHIKRTDWNFLNNGKSDIIQRPTAPTAYDILVCLQKYDVGSFSDFCGEFGYDEDSRSAKKTYKAVCKEYDKVSAIFSDEEIEELQEIQ